MNPLIPAGILFLLMPFIYSVRLQDMEQSPRFVVLAMVIAGSSMAIAGRLLWNRKKTKAPVMDLFHWVLAAWLVVVTIAMSSSINPGDALYEWLKILLFVSLFFNFHLALAGNNDNRIIIYRLITISALLFIVIGIYEFYPYVKRYERWGLPVKIDYSITSSLGNKNFFSETLLLILPFSGLAFLTGNRFWKVFSLSMAVLILISLVILQTWSTWMALVFGAITIALMIFWNRERIFKTSSERKYAMMAGAAILLVPLIAVVVFFSSAGSNPVKEKATAILAVITGREQATHLTAQMSVNERLIMWQNAVRVIKDHPWKGTGLANLKLVAPAYGLNSQKHMVDGKIRYTHPHNEFLFSAAETGIPGLALYATMMILLFIYTLSLSGRANSFGELMPFAMFAFFIAGFAVISLVSMPSTRFYPWIFYFLTASVLIAEKNKIKTATRIIPLKVIAIALTISILTGGISSYVGYRRLKHDFALSYARLSDNKKQYPVMKHHLETINRKIFPLDATATPIAWYLGYTTFYMGDRASAFNYFKEAVETNPNHLMALNDLGTGYNLSGQPDSAIYFYEKALTIEPEFKDARINLSIVHYNAGRTGKAYETLVRYRGHVRNESLPVFTTIILAQAQALGWSKEAVDSLREHLGTGEEVQKFLQEVQKTPLGEKFP